MKDTLKDIRSTLEIAQATGLSQQRVGNFKAELIKLGLARQVGKLTVFHKDAVEWLNSRKDKRGKWKREVRNG